MPSTAPAPSITLTCAVFTTAPAGNSTTPSTRAYCFIFSGRVLQLVRVRDLTAYVKPAPKNQGAVPTWQGGKMPLSSELADSVLDLLARAEPMLPAPPADAAPELRALAPLLALQARESALPRTGRVVFELLQTDEGHHLFAYPLAGRMVHIGLGALLAWRAARDRPGTFSLSMNDHGFELLSRTAFDWATLLEPHGPGSIDRGLLSTDHLLPDLQQALNATELSQRRFREIARVAGGMHFGFATVDGLALGVNVARWLTLSDNPTAYMRVQVAQQAGREQLMVRGEVLRNTPNWEV